MIKTFTWDSSAGLLRCSLSLLGDNRLCPQEHLVAAGLLVVQLKHVHLTIILGADLLANVGCGLPRVGRFATQSRHVGYCLVLDFPLAKLFKF